MEVDDVDDDMDDDMRGPAFKEEEEPLFAQLSPRTQGLLRGRLLGASGGHAGREHAQVRVYHTAGCNVPTAWGVHHLVITLGLRLSTLPGNSTAGLSVCMVIGRINNPYCSVWGRHVAAKASGCHAGGCCRQLRRSPGAAVHRHGAGGRGAAQGLGRGRCRRAC
jgi:hypothetical protein